MLVFTVPVTPLRGMGVLPSPRAPLTVSTGICWAMTLAAVSRPVSVWTVASVRAEEPLSVRVSTRAAGPDSSSAMACSVAA